MRRRAAETSVIQSDFVSRYTVHGRLTCADMGNVTNHYVVGARFADKRIMCKTLHRISLPPYHTLTTQESAGASLIRLMEIVGISDINKHGVR